MSDRTPGVKGRVTVIVPTLNSCRTIEACLASAGGQTYDDVEVVVVDNGSQDGTVEVAARYADRVEQWGPERSAQRNRGAAVATGEFLVFLDSDMVLGPSVVEEAVASLRGAPGVGAVVIPERAFGDGFWAKCRALEKELYLGDADVEAARVFRRDLFEDVGGYDESLTGGEDWDLPDRVARRGWQVGRIDALVWHDEGRIELRRCFSKKRYYGRGLDQYRRKATGGRRLTRPRVFGRPAVYVRAPVRAAGLLVLKAVEGAGIALGVVEGGRVRRG